MHEGCELVPLVLADRDVTAPELGDKTVEAATRSGAVTSLRRAARRHLGGSLLADATPWPGGRETMLQARRPTALRRRFVNLGRVAPAAVRQPGSGCSGGGSSTWVGSSSIPPRSTWGGILALRAGVFYGELSE
jgi:hypothetical protein